MTARKPKPSPLLIDILAPDPFDAGALLLEAVEAHCARTGATHEAIGRAAGIDKGNLSRALHDPNARPGTVRAVCRALGLRVALVRDETAADQGVPKNRPGRQKKLHEGLAKR